MPRVLLDVIVPVFGVVLIGYVVGWRRWIEGAAIRGIALYVFLVAVPVMLFRSMAIAELPPTPPLAFLGSFFFAACLVMALGSWLGRRRFALAPDASVLFGFGGAYSNVVLIGIPMVLTAFGDRAAVPLFLLVGTQALFMFPPLTMALESARASHLAGARRLLVAARGVVTNQYVVALALGLAFNLAGLSVPAVVDSIAELLGRSATPCALFALGASLSEYRIAGQLRPALAIVAIKLLVMPAAVWFLAAVVFGIEPLWTAVAVLVAAMPVGINMYLFSQRYDVALPLAASATVISTGASLVTVAVVLHALGRP